MKKNVYEPGEWVLNGTKKHRAFVVTSNQYTTEITITSDAENNKIGPKFNDNKGKKEFHTIWVNTHGLDPAPELPKIYSYDELNLALITRDKEWYEEIMKRKENEHAEG